MGPGNPGPGGPPAGATGSGGDAGPVSEQGNKGADSSLEKGTDSKGAEKSATGVTTPKGPLSGKVGQSKPRGRMAMSKDGQKKMSLRTGSGNPVRDVRLKQGKDNTGKTPSKGKTVADPSETNTGSKGKPVHDSGVKPAESKVDSMDKEVEEEVNQAFLKALEQKK